MKCLPPIFSLLACAVILDGPSVRAETVTLTPVADTTLFEHDSDNNQGANPTLAAGTTAGVSGAPARSRALLRFELTGNIPANATVISATLSIKVTKAPPARADSMFDLRRVLQPWNEGGQSGNTGSPAAAGETTWRARLHSSTPANATLWTAPGGGTNTDFSAAVSASTMVLGLGTFTFASAPELVADVQAWLNDPNSNQGWILMSQSEGIPRTARRIAAREANASDRPRLVVEFSVPPIGLPAELQSPQRLGDAFSFTFTAEANRAYAVEFAEALPVSTWQPLTNITAQAEVQEITVSDGSVTSSLHRFYRVRTQ